jgi:hypothetical protein
MYCPFLAVFIIVSVFNVAVAMASCTENVLCESCVTSVCTYVLYTFSISGAEGSVCPMFCNCLTFLWENVNSAHFFF